MKCNAIILSGLLLCTACISPEEVVRMREEQKQRDIAQCASYGLAPNTESFANCRMQLDLARDYARQARYYDPYPYAVNPSVMYPVPPYRY